MCIPQQHWDAMRRVPAARGPHPFKVGTAHFKFSTHFYNKLSQDDKKRWWDSKVEVLKCVIIDEIERGREGADCFISGKEPLAWWPKLLEAALPMAIAEAKALAGRDVTYDIRYASEAKGDLPPLQPIAAGKPAPSCGDMEVQHACGALKAMSLDHRARLDALTKWVQGPILASATVTYFQSLSPKYGGSYSEAERRTLQSDAKAREGGYEGPSPLEATLTEAQQAARTAARSRVARRCASAAARSSSRTRRRATRRRRRSRRPRRAPEARRRSAAGGGPMATRSRARARSAATPAAVSAATGSRARATRTPRPRTCTRTAAVCQASATATATRARSTTSHASRRTALLETIALPVR